MEPSKPLPIDEQIELINRVIDRFSIATYLCCEIGRVFYRIYLFDLSSYSEIKEYIPLFTRENAIKHSNAKNECYPIDAWWSCSDTENRLSFLNWILSELEKQKS